MARQEYECLQTLRRYDLVGSPHHVIQPLGLNRDINGVLAVEHYTGEEFSHAIARATQDHDEAHLYWRLKALAYFLATLHNRTANGASVDFEPDCRYFDTVVGRLKAHRIGPDDIDELSLLRDRWRERPRDVAGPAGLAARRRDPGELPVRPRPGRRGDRPGAHEAGDRMFDVGRIAGELQHAFMRDSGDWRSAEPFIGHFLWEYSCHFPDREQAFESITSRVPFYMALNLLRIARNGYIGQDYAGRLGRGRRSSSGRRLNAGPSSPGPRSAAPPRPASPDRPLHWPGRRAGRAHHALPGQENCSTAWTSERSRSTLTAP